MVGTNREDGFTRSRPTRPDQTTIYTILRRQIVTASLARHDRPRCWNSPRGRSLADDAGLATPAARSSTLRSRSPPPPPPPEAARRTSAGRKSRPTSRLGSADGSTSTPGPKWAALVTLPPGRLPGRVRARPEAAERWRTSIASVTPLASAIPDAWPIRLNPVTSVQAWTSPSGRPFTTSAASAIEGAHRGDGRGCGRFGARPNFMAVVIDASAERLGQQQHVARPGAGVRQHALAIGPGR